MSNLENSLYLPFELSPDKFTDGEYWAVGLFHDCPGEGFAKAIYWYFMEQFNHCLNDNRLDLINKINLEYDNATSYT